MTPLKAIRAKCLDCCISQANEVRLCPVSDCSLWPYRLGHNPKLKGSRPGIAANFTKNALRGAAISSSSVSDGESYGEYYAPKNPDTIAQNEAKTEAET